MNKQDSLEPSKLASADLDQLKDENELEIKQINGNEAEQNNEFQDNGEQIKESQVNEENQMNKSGKKEEINPQINEDQQNEISQPLSVPVPWPEICSIHGIKNKYVCVERECKADSRIACAECHVEGPHPKHELIRSEVFKNGLSQKAKNAIDVMNSISREQAKQKVCSQIEKIELEFKDLLNLFMEEKLKRIDEVDVVGVEDTFERQQVNSNPDMSNQINLKEILLQLSQEQVDLKNKRLTQVALELFASDNNNSIDVSRANFGVFMEEMMIQIKELYNNVINSFDISKTKNRRNQSDPSIRDKANPYDQIKDDTSLFKEAHHEHEVNSAIYQSQTLEERDDQDLKVSKSCTVLDRNKQTFGKPQNSFMKEFKEKQNSNSYVRQKEEDIIYKENKSYESKQATSHQVEDQQVKKLKDKKEEYNWRERKEKEKREEELRAKQEEDQINTVKKKLQIKLKGICIKKLTEHKGWIGRIERLSDDVFASCSSDKKVIFWNISTMKVQQVWEDKEGVVPNGENQEQNNKKDEGNNKSSNHMRQHILSLCKLDEKTIGMGGSDKMIKIYEWSSQTMLKILKGHRGGVNGLLAISSDVLVSCGSDNSLVVWNWKQDQVLNHIENHHTMTIYSICQLHSSEIIASCSKDSTIKIYNLEEKAISAILKGAKQAVHAICYLKRSQMAAGSADSTIRIWNYSTQTQQKVIKVPNQSIYALCKIDNHYLASGSSDNKIKIWAYEEGETLENSQDSRHGSGALCVKTLDSHTSAVSSLCYLPEKLVLISGSNDHSICLWH